MSAISPRADPRLYAARDAAAGRAGSASVRSMWTSHEPSRTAVHVARSRSRYTSARSTAASPGEHPSAAAIGVHYQTTRTDHSLQEER